MILDPQQLRSSRENQHLLEKSFLEHWKLSGPLCDTPKRTEAQWLETRDASVVRIAKVNGTIDVAHFREDAMIA